MHTILMEPRNFHNQMLQLTCIEHNIEVIHKIEKHIFELCLHNATLHVTLLGKFLYLRTYEKENQKKKILNFLETHKHIGNYIVWSEIISSTCLKTFCLYISILLIDKNHKNIKFMVNYYVYGSRNTKRRLRGN